MKLAYTTLGLSALLLAACATTGVDMSKLAGTAERPQLTAAQAAGQNLAAYFAKTGEVDALKSDPWDPSKNGIGEIKSFKPMFTVAADGSGSHKTVQSAITAAIAKGGKERIYIQVKPGTYRERVCFKDGPQITLYSTDSNAAKVLIVDNKANGTKKEKDVVLNDCEGRKGATSYGTSGSTTFLAYSDGFQAKNLSIANDYDESISPKGTQAVALTTRGDKIILDNVRLLGNQDTLQIKSPSVGEVNRVYVTNSYIEGDVDFVFGRAVAVFDKVEFHSLERSGSEGGYVFAPSHAQIFPYGFLVMNSKFTGKGKVKLGRAWDDSSGAHTAKDGKVHLPNGMLVIRDSVLGAHIDGVTPWDKAASTKRPYNSQKPQTVSFGKPKKVPTEFPVNRLYEFNNSGPGAAK